LSASVITGWYTRGAGQRQAEAARHAGDRQADAMVATVRMTLVEQRAARELDQRRQTYLRFVELSSAMTQDRSTNESRFAELRRAYSAVELEGPDTVIAAARDFVDTRLNRPSAELLEQARQAFLRSARRALADVDADAANYPDVGTSEPTSG
jgi:hypothetical protein